MKDLTILYYTANLINDEFSRRIRDSLLEVVGDTRIISISHKPMDFGDNMTVDMPIGVYSIYKQVFVGAQHVRTPFIACAEDDSLYPRCHFEFRPPDDTFSYNGSRWNLHKDKFIFRNRLCMSTCVAPTALLLDTLGKRFDKYPDFLDNKHTRGFCEPGRHEEMIGLPPVKMMAFQTEPAPLVFWHRPSMGGVRKLLRNDVVVDELPGWGKAIDVWNRYYERSDFKWSRDWAVQHA